MTPGTCEVCGRPLRDTTGQRGRPPRYCPPRGGRALSDCARLVKRMQEVQRLTERIIEETQVEPEGSETTRQSLQRIKGYLWAEVNVATNRGRLLGTSDKRYGKKRSGWWRLAPR